MEDKNKIKYNDDYLMYQMIVRRITYLKKIGRDYSHLLPMKEEYMKKNTEYVKAWKKQNPDKVKEHILKSKIRKKEVGQDNILRSV